jgi:hypothetical protein
MRELLLGGVLAATLLQGTARADEMPPPPPITAPVAAPIRADRDQVVKMQSAKFSGGRLVVEILAGALVGSLAAVATYNAAGGDIGGAIAALGVNVVSTPLIEWGVGRAMGGQGTLGSAYYGGIVGFGSGGSVSAQSPGAALVVGEIMMPITSALFFEISSNNKARQWELTHHFAATIKPVATPHGDIAGATLTAGWRF